jgi:hypothetical protein
MIASPRPKASRRSLLFFAGAGLLATTAAGCSEPAPLIPEGAWSLVFSHPSSECAIEQHNAAIGEVSPDKKQTLVKDGEANSEGQPTSVLCTVIDNGGTFEFYAAENDASGKNIIFLVNELPPDASEDKPAVGTVTYASPTTAAQFNSNKCNFYFLPNTGQGAKAGEVWFTFSCPEIAAALDNVCAIEVGYAAFANCDSKADEE